MDIDKLIIYSQDIEEIASKIQSGDQIGLSNEEISAFVDKYQNWYAECLAVLPDDLKIDFQSEFKGTWYYPKIRGFLEAPTKPNVIPRNEEATAAAFSPWQHPYDRFFRSPLLAQRQLLLVAYKRQQKTPTRPGKVATADDITHKRELIALYKKNLRVLEKQKAQYGIDFPIHIQNGIDFCQEEIRRLEQEINKGDEGE